jgi:hypothetical protein
MYTCLDEYRCQIVIYWKRYRAQEVQRNAYPHIRKTYFSRIPIHPNTNSMVCTFTGSRGCACHFLCCTWLSTVVATGCDISTAWRTFTLSCCTYSILSNTAQTHSKAGEKMQKVNQMVLGFCPLWESNFVCVCVCTRARMRACVCLSLSQEILHFN